MITAERWHIPMAIKLETAAKKHLQTWNWLKTIPLKFNLRYMNCVFVIRMILQKISFCSLVSRLNSVILPPSGRKTCRWYILLPLMKKMQQNLPWIRTDCIRHISHELASTISTVWFIMVQSPFPRMEICIPCCREVSPTTIMPISTTNKYKITPSKWIWIIWCMILVSVPIRIRRQICGNSWIRPWHIFRVLLLQLEPSADKTMSCWTKMLKLRRIGSLSNTVQIPTLQKQINCRCCRRQLPIWQMVPIEIGSNWQCICEMQIMQIGKHWMRQRIRLLFGVKHVCTCKRHGLLQVQNS